MYKKAMSLAPDANEKKRVLSGLASTGSAAGLDMAAGYLGDAALQAEAELAVVKICQAIYESHPAKAKGALEKVIRQTKNESLRKQAGDIAAKIAAQDKAAEE